MRGAALIVVVAVLGACAPAVEGAACLRHDNCPDTQYCTAACTCVTGDRASYAEACAGYRETATLSLTDAPALLQCAANGRVLAVWTAQNGRGKPEVRQFAVSSGGAWDELFGYELAAASTASPMGLAPSGDKLAVRLLSGVTQVSFSALSQQTVDVWFEQATAVASSGTTIVASFASLGVRTKAVGDSASVPGTLLAADVAEELQISRDGRVVAARFGAVARRYRDGGAVGSWAATALDLSNDGTTLALARATEVQVISDVAANQATLPVAGARLVALDGAGRTLVLALEDSTEVWAAGPSGWARVGALPLRANGLALSDDGQTLFVGRAGAVGVFTSFR